MSSTIRLLVACATSLAGVYALTAPDQDWSQWRGARRDAKAGGFESPATWPKTLTQQWKVAVGEGAATPALVGDRLYVFSRENGNEVTRCLEAGSGRELWQDQYESLGATGPAGSFSGPRGSPVVANGKVVTFGVRGRLSCLDATTGKVLWRKEGKPDYWPRFFTANSPIILKGLCIVQLGGESGGSVTAFDLVSGEEKWSWTGDGTAYASPVAMTLGGDELVVTQTASKLIALKSADGKLVWEIPFAAQGRGYNTATPIVNDQTIIYTGSDRGTTAVKLEKQGDKVTGTELWSNKDSSVQFSTPVLAGGLIFGLTPGNEFFCLDARTGRKAWTASVASSGAPASPGPGPSGGQRGGRGRGGGGFGSIVNAGAVLLALTPASELIAFAASDKEYTELARIKVAATPTHAYPVVSGRRIFIKDADSVALLTFE